MNLKKIKLFLLDMDGTIYLDNELIDGALDFLEKINSQNKQYILLTNNSSKSKYDYLEKLNKLNIKANINNIFTSGMAMGIYLNKNFPSKSIYLVGTKALKKELSEYNIKFNSKNPDIVVVGFDRELNYKKLEKACEFIDNGATFLATNIDYVCPIKNKRYIPDCGSICNMITNATKKEATFIGKPKPDMINLLKEQYNLNNDEIVMIGDRVYTDIACGYKANVKTVCVLSGESTQETISASNIKPDIIVDSIKNLIELI